LRTLAALLTFFATFAIVWLVLVVACAAVIHGIGIEDREGAIGLGFALLVAPLIAFAVAVACGIYVITPRSQSAPGR
jgi:hypothetical protein